MTRDDINQQIEAFFAKGGKVTTVAPETRAFDEGLRFCRCGCHGNYTDHSMRAGESGRHSGSIVK